MLFCCIGIGLMGVDLFLTRNIFTHIGELMAASIICLTIGLILDRKPGRTEGEAPAGNRSAGKAGS